jgi:hypothetical protein
MTGATGTVAEALALADAEGARLWPHDGKVHYRSPNAISHQLQSLIVANKPELMERLAQWDLVIALILMFEADEAVATSGVSGTDGEIQEHATKGEAAHWVHDMAGVRAACALIENRVRKLVAQRRQAA